MATLIIFTRYPEPGQVKSRLVGPLSAASAADLHRRMTLHTLRIADRCDAQLEVRYTGGNAARMGELFGARRYVEQGTGDLGQRMARAVADHLSGGARGVVIIGTDAPGLTRALLSQAFASLARHDLVIGPATDGGYYLIGLRRPCEALFTGIAWGTESVHAQTLAAAGRLGLSVHRLPALDDVDRPQDLHIWRRHNRELSIIVPALNEDRCLGPTLERLRTAADVQIIVADGGSTDGTVAIARAAGAQFTTCPRGRAKQINAAVAQAEGGRLLFCHADTLVPDGYDCIVADVLDDPSVALGAFSFRLGGRQTSLRRIEFGTNLRSRLLKLPYGDQALFLRRGTFDRLGGFAEMPAMEDFDLVRRARRLGRVVVVPQAAVTSPRCWYSRGALRTTLLHQRMIAAYYLGIPARRPL